MADERGKFLRLNKKTMSWAVANLVVVAVIVVTAVVVLVVVV